jgi:fatty-acyl-CoA synthase
MNMGFMLKRVAEEKGNREAVVFENIRMTYKELNSRVNRLAKAMSSIGLKKGDRAAVLLFNCSQYLEIYYAAAKLGVILVTMNYRLAEKELQYILDDSQPSAFFYGRQFDEVMPSLRQKSKSILNYIYIGDKKPDNTLIYESLLMSYPDKEPDVDVHMDDDQLIIYTSGTTGYPKGALITHANTLWTCINQIIFFKDLNENDSALVVMPLYHCGAQNDFTTPLFHLGGKLIIMEKVDTVEIAKIIQKERITTALLLPTLLHMIFQMPDLEKYDFRSLRYVQTGGAPLPDVTIDNFYKKMGYHICQVFGLTEGTALTTILDKESAARKKGSAGRPLFHVDLKIVDDDGNEVPRREIGELIQKGPTVMKGYWNNQEATRKTVKDGWLYTGDLARCDEEGFVYIVDRKKDMIISGEENIYPAEIEQVLYSHPKIQEAAVIGIFDEKWGESVKAIVVCKAGQTMTAEEVINHCKEHMASYKKPKVVEFISELPRNPSQKILKGVLREKYGKK